MIFSKTNIQKRIMINMKSWYKIIKEIYLNRIYLLMLYMIFIIS